MSGKIIFHNKKQVVTNAKEKKKQNISFYFVLSSLIEERPEFSQKTEFWQIIWDEPEQTGQSLKWYLCPKKINEPPNKKQRALVSIEPTNGATPPQTFQAALSMLLAAWKKTYGNLLKFPTELIAFFPSDRVSSVAGSQQELILKPDSTPIQALARDIPLPSGHVLKNVPIYYELYTSSAWSARKKDSLLVKALETVLNHKSTVSTLFERYRKPRATASSRKVQFAPQDESRM